MDVTGLRLSAMRAFWGIVTPNLREVSIQEKNSKQIECQPTQYFQTSRDKIRREKRDYLIGFNVNIIIIGKIIQ
ncbi:MAG: hypothetical protein ACH350_10500 [Parachlamydiaceae bacterium]